MSHTTKTELADIIARSFSEAVGKEIAALPVDKQTAAADAALAVLDKLTSTESHGFKLTISDGSFSVMTGSTKSVVIGKLPDESTFINEALIGAGRITVASVVTETLNNGALWRKYKKLKDMIPKMAADRLALTIRSAVGHEPGAYLYGYFRAADQATLHKVKKHLDRYQRFYIANIVASKTVDGKPRRTK